MTKSMLASFALALIVFAIASTEMQARTTEGPSSYDRHASDGRGFVSSERVAVRIAKRPHHKRERRMKDRPAIPANYASNERQVVGHPAGCPARAFCGCGASVEVFGRSVRDLWPARAWYRFPRAAPAPGMVAVRSHHVFVIRQVLGGGNVLAFDANSGGHRTHIHVRNLAGYTVVNPRGGSRYASAQ